MAQINCKYNDSILCILYYFLDIDECGSNPCKNGGTCGDGIFSYTCTCVPGYTGHDCETGDMINKYFQSGCKNIIRVISRMIIERKTFDSLDINDCNPNPCQNGGTCTDGVNGYTCDCITGWGGDNCELSMYFGRVCKRIDL